MSDKPTGELLEVESLRARYGEIVALDGVSLQVGAGEVVALLGANGAGKSTLIKSIMGIVTATEGAIRFRGQALAGVSPSARARGGLGYSPEGRRVFPGMSVRDNLLVASRASARVTAAQLNEIHQLFPALLQKEHAMGWQLSGGQQQMLAIGRALMSNPRLLLLDEPSLGLSPVLTSEVMTRIRAIRDRGTAVLLAEQNVAKALEVADRGYVMQLGRIVEHGTAAQLEQSPLVLQAVLGG